MSPKPTSVRYNDWRQVAVEPLETFTPVMPVSVIIPCYQTPAETLARTLAALEGQTYPSGLFEVVLADDGSQPPLSRPRSTPLDVKVVRQERLGFGAARARNTGARAAAGDILLFLDSDMLAEAGWLAAHARWHHAVSDALTIGSYAHVAVDDVDAETIRNRPGTLKELFEGRKVNPSWVEPYLIRTKDLTSKADDLFRVVVGGNLGVRREFYELVGGGDESFTQWGMEDTEFGWRAYTRGGLLVPARDAFAWHQGPWEEGRAEKRQSLKLQRAKCAHLIAHPGFRTGLRGRTFTVPQYVVTLQGDGGTSAGRRRACAGRPDARSGGAGRAGRGPRRAGVAGAPVGSGPAGAGGAGALLAGRVPHVLVPRHAAGREAAAWGRGAQAAGRTGNCGDRQVGVSRRILRVDHAGVGPASGAAHAVGGLRLRRGGDDPAPEAAAGSPRRLAGHRTRTGPGVAGAVGASAGRVGVGRRCGGLAVRPVVRERGSAARVQTSPRRPGTADTRDSCQGEDDLCCDSRRGLPVWDRVSAGCRDHANRLRDLPNGGGPLVSEAQLASDRWRCDWGWPGGFGL